MKAKFQFHAKQIGNTAMEVGAFAGGMILTKKFLDFNTLFKNQIASDPNFANKWFIKQQGWIRFGVGLIAASYIKNPWLKIVALGMATEGAITGIRSMSGGFFDAIGKAGQANNQALPPADDKLLELAKQIDEQTQGVNPVYEYGSSVAGMVNPTTEYPSSVAGNESVVDLTDSIPMMTAGFADEWQTGRAADWAA